MSLIRAIMALFFLRGYANGLTVGCPNDDRRATVHQDPAPGYLYAFPAMTERVLANMAKIAESKMASTEKVPPDVVPLTIEYPPELA